MPEPQPPFLTRHEVADLTPGITTTAARIRHLQRMGIRAERRPDGSVLVLRCWLTEDCRREPERAPAWQPDWGRV